MPLVKRYAFTAAHRSLHRGGAHRTLHRHAYQLTLDLDAVPPPTTLDALDAALGGLLASWHEAVLADAADTRLLAEVGDQRHAVLPAETSPSGLCRHAADYLCMTNGPALVRAGIQTVRLRLVAGPVADEDAPAHPPERGFAEVHLRADRYAA